MKETDIIHEVLKKYDLSLPLTWMEKRRIARVKRRTLALILAGTGGGRIRFSVSLGFYRFMKGIGLQVSPAAGARAAFAAAVISLMVITGSAFLVVESGLIITGDRGDAVMASAGEVSAGDLTIRTGEEVKTVAAGGSLKAGDLLSTGSSAPVFIKLKSGAQITAMQGTAFSVNDAGGGDSIVLNEGCVISRVPQQSGRLFEVRTPDSSVRVTGTVFGVIYKNGKTSVMAAEGSVNVTHDASGAVFDLQSPGFVESSTSMKRRDLSEKEKLLMESFISAASGTGSDKGQQGLSDCGRRYNEMLEEKSAEKRITLDDIRAKYGQIDEVVLYSGRRYTGAVISRGAVMKIMTVNGVVNVPSDQVRNIILK